MLADVVRGFVATITVGKVDGAAVDGRSVLSLVGLDIKLDDVCVIVAEGEDSAAAIAALREFVHSKLDEAEELADSQSQTQAVVGSGALPFGLRKTGVSHAVGRAVNGGVGQGVAVFVEGLTLPREAREARPKSREAEVEAARRAVGAVREELRRRAEDSGKSMERDLLRAHAEIASDPALWAEVERGIAGGGTAAQAVVAAAERLSDRLRAAESAYIRDRVVDIQDVCMQLVDRLLGGRSQSMQVSLTRESVVFADALTANQLLGMDRKLLRGLVLGRIGATSHTVILARSHRIPTIIDVSGARSLVKAGDSVIVDGDSGCVVPSSRADVSRYYERERRVQERWRQRVGPLGQRPAVTADGVRVEIGTNASTAGEVADAVASGAEGVGLLRTEVLFLDRESAPSEREQFEAYSAVIVAAAGRPVIIRTFDIGGDKPAGYMHLPREENPFLGVRGLRVYERHLGLLKSQLRAIVRASALGPVKVMAPMVATPREAAWFRDQVRAMQAEVNSAMLAFDPAMPVGVMIEVPSTALIIDQLCEVVDFFSIGTNDLCQYWMAADRGNSGVAGLSTPRQPSFLRLLQTIVSAARERGKWIGMCGDMASDVRNVSLLVGLGLDELSVTPGEVLSVKSALAGADSARCRELLKAAVACRAPAEVEELVRGASWRAPSSQSILSADLIEVASDAQTKQEAIKAAVDLLYIAGRTQSPRAVEEAAWAREATYSTGLGYGFAVPHCKSEAVSGASLAVVKLASPIEWGAMDGQPVEVVLMLTVPTGDAAGGGAAGHMKVFAKLARRLMHEEFRERLRAANDRESIGLCLRQELEIE